MGGAGDIRVEISLGDCISENIFLNGPAIFVGNCGALWCSTRVLNASGLH